MPTGLLSAPLACSSFTQTLLCSAVIPLNNSLTAGGNLWSRVKMAGNVRTLILKLYLKTHKSTACTVEFTWVVIALPCMALSMHRVAVCLQSVQIPPAVGLVSMATMLTGRPLCLCYRLPEPGQRGGVVVNKKRRDPPSFIHSFIHSFRNVKEEGWEVDEMASANTVFGFEH